MKEANVLSQLALVESINKGRQSQIDAISNAILAFRPEPRSPQSRIYSYVAVYLSFLSQWLEKEIGNEMMYLSELKNLPHYTSDLQIDFRLAHSLGVLEGLNHLGSISSDLIAHSQRALHKAGLLALAGHERTDLKAFDDSKADELYIAYLEASKPTIAKMEQLVKTCLSLTTSFEKRTTNEALESDVSIASSSSTACGTTIATVLTHLGKVLAQPFSDKRAFEYDPAHHACGEDVQIARAIAAGIAADVVAVFIRKKIRWTTVSLN